jgi:hypothetical protein
MNIVNLQAVVKSVPFQPFTIHTSDGRKFRVPHPEFVAFAPSGEAIVVHQVDDTESVIAFSMIQLLEIHPTETEDSSRTH